MSVTQRTQEDLLPALPIQTAEPGKSQEQGLLNMRTHSIGDALSSDVMERAATTSGSLMLFGVVEIVYSLQTGTLHIEVKLLNVLIGKENVTHERNTITVAGSALGLKAEVTLTFDFSTLTLTVTAKACEAFGGCQSGTTTVHL